MCLLCLVDKSSTQLTATSSFWLIRPKTLLLLFLFHPHRVYQEICHLHFQNISRILSLLTIPIAYNLLHDTIFVHLDYSNSLSAGLLLKHESDHVTLLKSLMTSHFTQSKSLWLTKPYVMLFPITCLHLSSLLHSLHWPPSHTGHTGLLATPLTQWASS